MSTITATGMGFCQTLTISADLFISLQSLLFGRSAAKFKTDVRKIPIVAARDV